MTLASFRVSLGVGGVLSLISKADVSTLVTLNGAPCSVDSIVIRNVCIIGRGSTGTYSAIRLLYLGKNNSGGGISGHIETYTDPMTKGFVDYDAVAWHDLDIVGKHFAGFNISLEKVGPEEV
ncbi:hypothetical protein HYALB_00004224 [Hymenoscyphus albidus]|uniref:Uncharacterized protein n=1 Tax=Hymenoscyphus albidus TaxID=595503 RepID=A0A9N9QE39_9HELO|nr:hypothetical protein HYALB_00004224 [Hymenoscyphus albidus]